MITELYNEDALECLALMIEPASQIFSDKEVAQNVRGKKYIEAIKVILTKYKSQTVQLLALANGQKVEEYKANIVDMTRQLMALFNNKELMEVFSWQSTKNGVIPSGSAMENTEATEEA